MTEWLMTMHCSQKTMFCFLSVFNSPTFILSAWNHFCGIFLNCHKYFQEIFLRRIWYVTDKTPFFEICLRRLKDVTWKNIFIEMYLKRLKGVPKEASFLEMCLRRLKDVTKKTLFLRCIWDVLKTSQKDSFFEMYLRCLKDVTKETSLLRCFWEVSDMPPSMEIWLRHLKDISCRLGPWISLENDKAVKRHKSYYEKQ